MKKFFTILTCVICLPCFAGCISFDGGIKPSSNFITRDYKVTEFNKINTSAIASIYYTQSVDNSTSVKIYGPDNIVDLVEVSIADNALMIRMKKKNISNVNGMKVYIASPGLIDIVQKGVGNFIAEEGIRTQSLRILNDGVGNIKLKGLACENITVESAGVGNVELSGEAVNATLTSGGVGNLKAENLKSDNVKVVSDGVGNISCHAVKTLSATNKGVGNIRYKGNPEEKNLNKSGVGSIKQL